MLHDKRFIRISIVIIGVIVIGRIIVNQNIQEINTSSESMETPFDYSDWGKALKEIENKNQKDSFSKKENEIKIIAKGNSEFAVITEPEYQRSLSFYKISGLCQAEAETAALEECKKTAALYAEARRRGIFVSDQEVRDYVYNELKPLMESADNNDDMVEMMNGFGGQEEYWDLECKIYEKMLPIQELAEQLKKEYSIKSGILITAIDFNQKFSEYYQEFQDELVTKENFK